VLIDKLSIEANLALPLTLSIDPLADDIRMQVAGLADEVGLPASRLAAAASTLTAEERLRVHLARAIALNPALVLLEHPTASLPSPDARQRAGEALRAVADRRAIGWVALTDEAAFARASGARRVRVIDGDVRSEPLWRRVAAGIGVGARGPSAET
jgi:ABC-type lipoprotein export system ATPase subunit